VVVPTVASPVTAASPAAKPASGVTTPSQLTGTIKIVSSLPRTGNNKTQTDAMVNGIRMALDEARGRADNAMVIYEDLDDTTPNHASWDAGKVAENANRAVDDQDVMVVIGPYNSGAAKVAIPILNRADLVMISPSNTYPGLTKPGKGAPDEPDVLYPTGTRTYSRVIPSDDVQGVVAAGWAKQLGAQRVYLLDDHDLFGGLWSRAFAETAERIGLQVVGPEGIDPRASDYEALAARVRDANPDLVYVGGVSLNNTGKLFKDLRAALPEHVKLMGPDGLYEGPFLEEAGDAAEGAFITFGGVAPSKLTGKGAEWYRSYKVRYNVEPEAYAAYAYEATKVALDAIKRAGRKDRAAIREAVMATKDYDGILGRWSFDRNGDTTLTSISGRQVKEGHFDDGNAETLQAP
jgi:branched-chain amino acid transport system substrate-binding protein